MHSRLSNQVLKPFGKFATGADIYKIDEADGISYIILTPPDSKEAIYFVQHVRVDPGDLAAIKAGRQIMVWREAMTDRASLSTRFSTYVLFKMLLPKYKTIAADRQQTEYGKAFWERSLSRAFENKKHVYVLDHTTQQSKLTKYTSIGDILADTHKIWGKAHFFQKITPIISTVPLDKQ